MHVVTYTASRATCRSVASLSKGYHSVARDQEWMQVLHPDFHLPPLLGIAISDLASRQSDMLERLRFPKGVGWKFHSAASGDRRCSCSQSQPLDFLHQRRTVFKEPRILADSNLPAAGVTKRRSRSICEADWIIVPENDEAIVRWFRLFISIYDEPDRRAFLLAQCKDERQIGYCHPAH